jgi:hypothetical protein
MEAVERLFTTAEEVRPNSYDAFSVFVNFLMLLI